MQRPAAIAVMALCLCACGAAARRASVDPRAPGAARIVVGRIAMFKDGERLALAKSGMTAALSSASALATLSLQNSASGERFTIPIEDEQGWFAAELPPGSYGAGVQYYIWVFGTPARIEVPADPARCWLGTLQINLFARRSALGGWARTTGGTIPMDDIDFAVVEPGDGAAAYAGSPLPACPMSLVQPSTAP